MFGCSIVAYVAHSFAGLFCCTLYHFFVHDVDGPIGAFLRRMVPEWIMLGLDEATFGVVCVGLWMQICGLLQMPQILGPSFSPFNALISLPSQLMQKMPKTEPAAYPAPVKVEANGTGTVVVNGTGPITRQQTAKKRRPRNKKKEL